MIGPCSVLFATALGYGSLSTFTAQEAVKCGMDKPWLFLSCMAIGMMLTRIVITRRGLGQHAIRRLPVTLWITFAGLVILALAPGCGVRHAISGLFYGAGYSLMYTLLNIHVLDTVSSERRGAAFGVMLFAFDSGIGLGALLIGQIIGHSEANVGATGFRIGWATAALMALLAVPLACRLSRSTRMD